MLNSIRRQAGSWVVKILLLLLVASFAVWGIGDIFYGGAQNPVVAEVGPTEILSSELTQEFDRVVDNVQRRLGTGIDREQAIQLGLMQQALQDLIARRLVDLRAREMGLTVSDETLRQMILDNPAFQTAGRFERARFEQILLASGLSEEGYLAALRQDLVRGTLTESLAAPVRAPDPLVDAMYRHRNEERRGRMLVVPTDSVEDVPEPDEEALQAYHEANQQRFTAPEFRKISYIQLSPDDLLEEVQISDQAVQATYEQRADQYREPEVRNVLQLLADDQAKIQAAADRVAEGASLEEAAAAIEGVSLSDLGEVSPGQLPPELEGAIFDTAEGELSAPVESPFGWHLFRVTEVQEEQVVPLAEVQDAIRDELAREEAMERLPSLANALDDELAAGATLEEAADTLRLEVETIDAVDPRGRGPEGERPANLPDDATFLDVALTTPEDETSLLEEGEDGGYFVLRVDEVTPPRVKPVDEVRDALIAAWTAERRRELARERASALLQRLQEGGAIEGIAEQNDLEIVEIAPVTRRGAPNQPVTGEVVRALFEAEPGTFASAVVEVPEGYAAVTTDEILGANPADDQDAADQLATALQAEIQNDILSQFSAALRRDYPVEVDTEQLARLNRVDGFSPGAAGFF